MKLSDLSIRRPVLASMISLALVLFGVIGYTRLAGARVPRRRSADRLGQTVLPGANPQVVESAVTDILEEELSTVEGLRTLTSASAEQFSNITLEFKLDRDVEDAAQDVRDKVSRVRGRLPEDIEEPVVAKQEADAQPVHLAGAVGRELRPDAALGHRRPAGQAAAADDSRRVGRPIFGERRFSMRVWLSAARARGARAHGAGRRERDPHAQRRDPGGPDRIGPARVLGALPRRAEDAGRVRRSDGGQQRRPAGQARRRRRAWSWGRRTSAASLRYQRARRRSSSASCGSRRPT